MEISSNTTTDWNAINELILKTDTRKPTHCFEKEKKNGNKKSILPFTV